MLGRRTTGLAFALAIVTVAAVAPTASAQDSGVGPGREPVPGGFADTVRVPRDAASLQEAVDAAEPGGMVLIDPGTYRESVVVRTPFLTIRGMDRDAVIIDGEFERAIGVHVIEADGVAIENLTVRNHRGSGVRWTRVHGFRGSLLTAIDNGGTGIAVVGSDWGQIDRSYASGSAAGFSVEGCFPCHAVVRGVIAEHNAIGFRGNNAGGALAIVNSAWQHNEAGIVPSTVDSRVGAPQRDALIAGNLVLGNNDVVAGAGPHPVRGTGVLVAGGVDNLVTGNLVQDHERYGIAVLPTVGDRIWVPSGNEVRGNVVRSSGLADLALGAPAGGGDCFTGNDAGRTAPPAVELLRGCDSWVARLGGGSIAPTLVAGLAALETRSESSGDGATSSPPPDLPAMADPANAPPRPAIPEQSVPQAYRIRPVDSIAATEPTVGALPSLFGAPLAASWWGLVIGLYGYVLPGILYAAWVTIALWDLIRQESRPISFRARWMAVALLVPFAGPLLYFAFGRSPIPAQLRLMLTAGGLGATALISVAAALAGR
jgi:hypothetical protein